MAQCHVCGRGRVIGNNVSHANNRTKRTVYPNLQRKRVQVAGGSRRVFVCTRCLRSGRVQQAG